MRFVVVTGMSGAGKSTTLKMLEDVGYFCVDNLPIPLIIKFAELIGGQNSEINKVALGIDVRSGRNLQALESSLEQMEKDGFEYEILYLDSSDEVLIKRYKETRRSHPLSGEGRVDQGIMEEREKMAFLKKKADYIIDTSKLLTRELKAEIDRIFVDNESYNNLFVTVLSFGFKYGIPNDADLVFDVRFLPNPYYIDELRSKTGNDAEIQNYVMNFEESHKFLDKLEDMVRFLIPNYVVEGKNQLVIAVGCTGGKHRSVTLANKLYERLNVDNDFGLKIEHRDIYKDSIRKK